MENNTRVKWLQGKYYLGIPLQEWRGINLLAEIVLTRDESNQYYLLARELLIKHLHIEV